MLPLLFIGSGTYRLVVICLVVPLFGTPSLQTSARSQTICSVCLHIRGDMFGGADTHAWSAARMLFPSSAEGLLDGSFYAPGLIPPAKKIGKVCLSALGKRKIDIWKCLVSPTNVGGSLTQSDSVIALGRSDLGRLSSPKP